jgi:hypothetical protein
MLGDIVVAWGGAYGGGGSGASVVLGEPPTAAVWGAYSGGGSSVVLREILEPSLLVNRCFQSSVILTV